ncbi:MAG: hypothetical protein ACI9TB_001648 [Parasphingorhabdus sp.]|jgi:hypothetical protein
MLLKNEDNIYTVGGLVASDAVRLGERPFAAATEHISSSGGFGDERL